MGYLISFSVIYAVIFLVWYMNLSKEPEIRTELKGSLKHAGLLGLFLVFCLQLIVAGFMPGHVQDTALFRSWAAFAEEHPIWEYYTTEQYVDYPPVYLYVLYGVGKLAGFFGVSTASAMYLVCIRSVPILVDGLTCFCLYRLAKPQLGERKALTIGALSLLNPTNILNSTVWGQVDGVPALMVMAMLLFLYYKKYIGACLLMALLFLTKPQMIIFAPLLGFVFLFDIMDSWHDRKERRHMRWQAGLSVLTMVAVLLLVPLPVTGGRYGLIIEAYKNALGLYPYATLNAANLYGALGANWAHEGGELFIVSYKAWGFIFIVSLSLLVGVGAWKSRDRSKIFYLGAFTVLGIYMLAHGMHERYLHPLFLLLLCIYIFTKDFKMLLFYGAFSVTTFLSCGWVLMQNLKGDFIYGDNPWFRFLSLIHLLLFALWILHALGFWKAKPCGAGRRHKQYPSGETFLFDKATVPKVKPSARLHKVDYCLMIGLTLFYALFGFWHLGAKEVPQSGYYVSAPGESIVLDLGKPCEARQLYVYTGWIDRRMTDYEVQRSVTVEWSLEKETWTKAQTTLDMQEVFMWNVFRELTDSCRYIRLTCDDGRFYMNEIAVFGENKEECYPIVAVESDNPTATLVMDEPQRVTYDFSWYETTYFDEIYHPRTAFEYITHRYPYENTHPPLGKVIIACGMLLFGVNPFGWRFFGTLCGVLMVPMAYMMGKKLLKNTRYAFLTAFVFSFDFMHLSQTRLATIDSYTAFFVMGMYLFMFLYIEKSLGGASLQKSLPFLGLSGLFFGLGASTKWQGLYAGIGLAVLFFYCLFRRYRAYRVEVASLEQTRKTFWAEALKTILAGFLFFVFVPAVIYFLSYIPAMQSETTGLSFFFTNQSSMFNYHAHLESAHPYSSKWWQWLFDYKPLYAYSPDPNFVSADHAKGITTFGNPAIWWLTIPLVLWGLYRLWKQRKGMDAGLLTTVVGFFSLYAPWIFVTRTTYIYHFFPCVIFVVLLLGFFFESKSGRGWRHVETAYMLLVFVLFLAFYPVLTGMEVPALYAQALRWLPGWVLG